MTTTLTEPITQAPTPGAIVGSPIAANMCGVDIVIRRPSGRVQLPQAEVAAKNDAGEQEKVDEKKVTKPQAIVDRKEDHPLWALLDDNARQCETVLARYSVNDARRGFHLVPMTKTPAFLVEIAKLRTARLDLARQLRDGYDTWIANLRGKFNGHFHLILPKLPSKEALMERFDVTWTLHPLTPLNPDNLDFSAMNEEDRANIIKQSNGMAQELIHKRAKVIYDEVFGTVLAKCDDVSKGGLETGKRKFGAVTEMVDLLERLNNFSEFASDPSIIQHANATLKKFKEVKDISDINNNAGQNAITAALKMATTQLGNVIRPFLASNPAIGGKGKSARGVLL